MHVFLGNQHFDPHNYNEIIMFLLQSGSKSGRGMSHDHGLSSRMPGGGRGGYSYVPQAGMFMPTMQGGRWMGPGGMPPAGMGYPRRDMVGGAMRTASWDSRIPSAFLSASQLKSSALRWVKKLDSLICKSLVENFLCIQLLSPLTKKEMWFMRATGLSAVFSYIFLHLIFKSRSEIVK